MKIKNLLFAIIGFFISTVAFSQIKIKGKVLSKADNTSLPGVTVFVEESKKGAITDMNGNFSIEVSKLGVPVKFSYIGFTTQTMPASENMTVSLMEGVVLDEFVITALGEKKSKDKQGSSSGNVKGLAVQSSGESSVIQGMSGKTSGVQITRSSGDPGAGAYIQIRGQSTVTQSVQPLIIIDGVPMSNTGGGSTSGVVQQSRLGDINPNDIESIEVLKGASAAAIWGSAAANGVIVVTTKKGSSVGGSGKKWNVQISSRVAIDQINIEHEKQDKYGQGSKGKYSPTSSTSWGDKISSRSGEADDVTTTGGKFVADDGTVYYPLDKRNSKKTYNDANRDQVFRNGVTFENNASVTYYEANQNLFISIGDWKQTGILNGNSDYRRTGMRANYQSKIGDKVSVKLNNYIVRIKSNRIQQGSNLNGLYLGYLRTPADFDNTDYAGNYVDANGVSKSGHRAYRKYLGNGAPVYNNPGWTLNKQTNTSDVNRIILTPEVNVDIHKNSKLTVRAGLDFYRDARVTYFPVNSAASNASGKFVESEISEIQSSFQIFDRTHFDITSNIKSSVTLGWQYSKNNYKRLTGSMKAFTLANQDIFSFINSTSENITPSKFLEVKANNRIFLLANFDFMDKIFLELTAAQEASSTYKGTYIYPSVNVAYQFTKDFMTSSNILSFGKLRVSWGQVGVEPPAYITATDYSGAKITTGWGESLDAANFGGSIVKSFLKGNADIKPEKKTEFEVGTDLRFFSNKISLSATYYSNKTGDVILYVDVAGSSGYSKTWGNAGEIQNKGIEIDLSGNVYKNKSLNVELFGNFTKNKNEVIDLKGSESIFLNGFSGSSSRAVKGQALGVLWGGKWDREADGSIKLDKQGFPTADSEEGIIGDPNPDFRAGFGTKISFKGFTLNVLFETSQGQDMWGGTAGVLKHFGVDPETAKESNLSATEAENINTTSGTVASSYDANADGTYTVRGEVKDFGGGKVLLDQSWYTGTGGGFGPVGEQFVKDASWTKLREVSLSYTFPKKIVEKLKIFEGITITATGRNLLTFTKFKGVDPELNLTGTTNGRGLDYFTNPGTRSFIFAINLNF